MNELVATLIRPWIEWPGGKCPVVEYEITRMRYRSGGTTEMQASKSGGIRRPMGRCHGLPGSPLHHARNMP